MSLAPNDRPARVDRGAVLVDLARQGGGAHGAFTWGVLDRFLEEDWLRIEGISGTSAGAMNAAVLADGHAAGGRQGAQTALRDFWRRIRCGTAQPVSAKGVHLLFRLKPIPLMSRDLVHRRNRPSDPAVPTSMTYGLSSSSRRIRSAAPSKSSSVSYTHLTLPTILLV